MISEFSYGVNFTSGSVVGNYLGEKRAKLARKYAYSNMIIAAISSLTISFGFAVFNKQITMIYTNNQVEIDFISESSLIFSALLYTSLFSMATFGITRGIGYQSLVFSYLVVSYWIITPILTVVFVFSLGYNFTGIWIGLFVGSFVMKIAMMSTI